MIVWILLGFRRLTHPKFCFRQLSYYICTNQIFNILNLIKSIKYRLAYILFVFLIVLFPWLANSQEPSPKLIKSTEKVLIEGNVYYIHTVKKGETVYSICKAYEISPKLLSKENPAVIIGLQPGQVLKIPENAIHEQYPVDNEKYIFHKVKKGETYYSLSKQYNVTVQEIRDMNPDLDINDIPTDTIIRIPRIDFQQDIQQFETQKEPYFFYKVEKKESFTTIAAKFSITKKELRDANPDMHKRLRKGDVIKIPEKPEVVEEHEIFVEAEVIRDTIIVQDTLCNRQVPSYFINKVKVALLLPLYLDENDVREFVDSSESDQFGRIKYKTITRDEDWIFNKSLRFIEFYEGALIAMHKLQEKGMQIDLKVLDTGQDPRKVKELIDRGELDNMDMVIGPVYSMNVKMVTDYLEDKSTLIISPFAQKEDLLFTNPSLFQAKPSYSVETETLSGIVSRDYGKNIILVRPDDSLSIDKINLFKWRLVDSLKQYGPVENVILKEVFFLKDRARRDTINEIKNALVLDEPNTIVVLSQKETFVSEVLAKIFTLSKDYDFKVYGFPAWQQFRNIQLNYFHQMDLYLCSPYHLDYNKSNVINFLDIYRNKFKTEPAPFSFAWPGHDIATYFLTAFAVYGDDLLKCYPNYKADFLITGFEFRRTGEKGGAMNQRLFLLQYTKDFREEIFTLPPRPPIYKPLNENIYLNGIE